MRQLNVLVTGVGSCGVGEGIVKALNMANKTTKKYKLIGTDCNSLSAMTFRVDKGYLVPRASSLDYFRVINNICKNEKVDILIPGSDVENEVISNNKFEIKDAYVLVNPKEVVSLCKDKWKTYNFLKDNGFYCPESYIPEKPKSLKFPLIIKNRFGNGSKEVFKIENNEELNYYLKYFDSKKIQPIIQEYVGSLDEEYTVGVIVSKDNTVISSIALKRTLIAGASGLMVKKDFKDIREYCEKIALLLKPQSSINIQARLVGKKLYVFELNPRFSSTTPIRAGLGVNEVDILIEHYFLGKKFDKIEAQKEGVIMRCFQEVYGSLTDLDRLNNGEGIEFAGHVFDNI